MTKDLFQRCYFLSELTKPLLRTLHRTRITQRIVLSGDNAAAYVDQVQAGFGSNLTDGMKRIADAMAKPERSTKGGDDE